MKHRRLFIGVLAIAAGSIVACAPIHVVSFIQPDADIAAYRTFTWDRIDAAVPGDPRLDNNIFFHEHVRHAIERRLIEKGYEPTVLQPDLHVHYHVSSRQKVSVTGQQTTDRCRDCTVEVFDEGTLLIDLTDARTGALVWRGVAQSGLTAVVNDQRKMEETVDRIVARVCTKLPRRR
jgi:hypothetical protein